MKARSLALAGAVLLLVPIHALCGAPAAAPLMPESGGRITPLITTSELAVGANRFAFGLLKEQALLERANVLVRVYAIDTPEARLAAEVRAPYHALGGVKRGQTVHRHADGTRHVHGADSDVRGLYVTQLTFARPGPWGVELLVREGDGPLETSRFSVTVLDAPQTPALGMPAPRSRNLVASDVADLRQIDTSKAPDPRLHQVRIADAIAQGRPQLIVFATPQFCTTRMCGPVLDIVRTLLPVYGKRMVYTHQEIWEDFAIQRAFATVAEWGLRSEPWIFVVDSEGIVRGKFEGLVTVRELETAVQQVLKGAAERKR